MRSAEEIAALLTDVNRDSAGLVPVTAWRADQPDMPIALATVP